MKDLNQYKSATITNQLPPPTKTHLSLIIANTNECADPQKETKEKSPTSVKDVKDILLASSKTIIGKVLSPSKGTNAKKSEQKVDKPILMTRRELCDPFGSDDEEENNPTPDNKIISNEILETNDTKKVTSDGKQDFPKPNLVSIIL